MDAFLVGALIVLAIAVIARIFAGTNWFRFLIVAVIVTIIVYFFSHTEISTPTLCWNGFSADNVCQLIPVRPR